MTSTEPTPAGERDAARFTALLEAAAPRLWSWAMLRIGPRLRATVDPDDVLQEVSCRAWSAFGTFREERGSFPRWALGIARNVLGEVLARVARGEATAADWSSASWARVPDDATRATARVARDESLARFVAWVDGLDRDDRRIVVFRGLEGWGHAEVAQLLGVSEAAASKRWDRLRERLRADARVARLLLD